MTLGNTYNKGFSNNGAFQMRVVWSATQDIGSNFSRVTANLYIVSLQSWATVYDATASNATLSINGDQRSFSNTSTIGAYESKWIGSHTVNVYHNADGSRWMEIYATHNFDITWNGSYIGVVDVYGSDWLNTIPRASVPTITTTGIQYGSSIHVNLNKASSDFTHWVTIDIGDVQTNIGTMDQYTSAFDFALPLDWCARIPNLSSNAGKFTVHTYNAGGTYLGTNEVWFTATVPASVIPTVSAGQCTAVETVAGLTAKFASYVQGKSKVRATVAGTGAMVGGVQCSNIVGYKIEMNGQTFNVNDATSSELLNAGATDIVYTVIDSRGRTASRTVTIYPATYSAPILTVLTASRCNSDGTANDDGAYVKATIGASISNVNNLNDKIFKVSKKPVASGTWTDQTIASGTWTISTFTILSAIDGNFAWDIKFTVQDYFTTISKTVQVSTAFSLVDYFNGGKGLAFGKVAEKDGFENNLKTYFTGGVESIPLPAGDGSLAYWQALKGGYYFAGAGVVTGQPATTGAITVHRMGTNILVEWRGYTSDECWYLRITSSAVANWIKLQNSIQTLQLYNPTLSQGWWHYPDHSGGDYNYVKFAKTHENVVFLTGLLFVEWNWGTNGAVIFTLPAGYRPAGTIIFNQRSDSSVEHSRIEVHPNGQVTFNGATNSISWVSLASINFPAIN